MIKIRNLIPKKLNEAKYRFWRTITITDLVIISIIITLAVMFIFGLQCKLWIKLLVTVVMILFALPLLLTNQKTHLKGWQLLYYQLNFLFSCKNYVKNKTRLLVPFHKTVSNNFITTHGALHKTLIAALQVKGFDLTLLSDAEQRLRLRDFQDVFKLTNFSVTILKLELPLKFAKTTKYLQQQLKQAKICWQKQTISKSKYQAITKQIKAKIGALTNNGTSKTEPTFFVFVYGRSEQIMHEQLQFLQEKLTRARLNCHILTNYEITKILKLVWNPYDEPLEATAFKQHQADLAAILQFDYLKLKSNYFMANDLYYSFNTIQDYPLFINDLWGACLASNEQTVLFNIHPLNYETTKKTINSAIQTTQTRQVLAKSYVTNNENNYELQTYYQLIDAINGGGEILKKLNVFFLNYGSTKKLLTQAEQRLKNNLKMIDIKINPLIFRQFEALKSFIPWNNDTLMLSHGQEMPTQTLAAAFPFISSGISDEQGMILGQSRMGNVILWDQFLLNNKRTNHNMFIIGTSGAGKSFTMKKIINFHVCMQRKVIVIDPEREYKKICHYYDGQWIDTGDAAIGKINPLQVLDNNFDEENKARYENLKSAPVSQHLRFFSQWFKTLYPDFTDRELNLLIKYLKMLYQKWAITNASKIAKLTPQQFPTISHFYELLQQQQANEPMLQEFIAVIATDFLKDGKYEQLWNGYTTLKFNANFVVYDVLTLFEQDDTKVTAAQLHLVLAFIKAEVKHNRFKTNNEIVIVVDEAHLAIDKDNPAALNFMFQMVKRIRKYHGALIVATQNIADFVENETVLKKTTAIINNSQYSLIMNLKPNDLTKVLELYKSTGGLTAAEQDYIARAEKGQGLLIISSNERHCLQIEASSKEREGF